MDHEARKRDQPAVPEDRMEDHQFVGMGGRHGALAGIGIVGQHDVARPPVLRQDVVIQDRPQSDADAPQVNRNVGRFGEAPG